MTMQKKKDETNAENNDKYKSSSWHRILVQKQKHVYSN
jgi:hypothetical protein